MKETERMKLLKRKLKGFQSTGKHSWSMERAKARLIVAKAKHPDFEFKIAKQKTTGPAKRTGYTFWAKKKKK